MTTKVIQLWPDAPEPVRERVCDWVRANGLNPEDIPELAPLVVEGDTLTVSIIVDTSSLAGLAGERRTVPLLVPPPDDLPLGGEA